MSQQFKLTTELMDQIIFAMENQNESFLLDSLSLMIIPDTGEESDPNAIPLPAWNPSDGYQLMDSYTGILKNPIYRERLRTILNTGRGVFRGFKNVLKERPDLEKAWFAHKDREMKRRVHLWYSELCDYWGVESEGEEPEDISDLFHDDFSMEMTNPESEEFQAAQDSLIDEIFSESSLSLKELLIAYSPLNCKPSEYAVRAQSPDGSGCGFIGLNLESRGNDLYAILNCLYILPEYRGAGIASGLLDYVSEYCFHSKVNSLLVQLPPEGEVLRENLERRGFKQIGPYLLLEVEHWYYEQQGNS
ncbi:N-acetyltransferase [Oceanispirochaeta sp.]|jgi:GNAT superfamily N-acetyltransferase|uniref:GNAT family N-acetyltransferase n=1 Tax=Oceanispirochaeta sp. TaxID=2035350 RepID=UPI00260D03D9|nr:GNAT family N-acetyltransferase [Oceanispirochaeta sp.]MDA3957631.1 GNAT family N-acetyltransferase [Oceanispirochaeta sp.]